MNDQLPMHDSLSDESDRLPILAIVGVQGHLKIIPALAKHFQRPIEVMVITGQGMEYAKSLDSSNVAKVHSLPDWHKRLWVEVSRMSDSEVVRESRDLQEDLRLNSVNPYHYFDRNIRNLSSWFAVIRRHLINLRFVKHLLVNRKYHFIRGENTSHVGCMIQAAAPGLGHRFLRPSNARLPRRIGFDGRPHAKNLGWESCYRNICNGAEPDESIVRGADEWLEKFRNRPERPEWAQRNSRLKFSPIKSTKSYSKLMIGKLNRLFTKSSEHQKFDRDIGFARSTGLNFAQHVIFPDIRSAVHRRRKLFRSCPSLEGDFVYYPLHYTPEITTLVYGYRYEEQLSLIHALSAYLPTGCRLLVKEHTSMLGRRPYGFYKKLDSYYNVEFVPPGVSTFELIQKSIAVATITGTAGFEAFALGKPVFVFGDVFYRYFPNVLPLEIGPDMGCLIRSYLDGFVPDREEIRNCILAYFASTYRSTMVDVGHETTAQQGTTEAQNFANACEWALEMMSSELQAEDVQS